MEEAILQGLIWAVCRGLRADSSYKKKGWEIALKGVQAATQYPVTLKQIKSKHDTHKKD